MPSTVLHCVNKDIINKARTISTQEHVYIIAMNYRNVLFLCIKCILCTILFILLLNTYFIFKLLYVLPRSIFYNIISNETNLNWCR